MADTMNKYRQIVWRYAAAETRKALGGSTGKAYAGMAIGRYSDIQECLVFGAFESPWLLTPENPIDFPFIAQSEIVFSTNDSDFATWNPGFSDQDDLNFALYRGEGWNPTTEIGMKNSDLLIDFWEGACPMRVVGGLAARSLQWYFDGESGTRLQMYSKYMRSGSLTIYANWGGTDTGNITYQLYTQNDLTGGGNMSTDIDQLGGLQTLAQATASPVAKQHNFTLGNSDQLFLRIDAVDGDSFDGTISAELRLYPGTF